MSLLEETKFLLRRYRIFPKKTLGQHFLIEPSIFDKLCTYASLNNSDIVLDAGAGLGFLTKFLAGKCGEVLAVESDSKLVKVLRERFKNFSNVKIIKGDLLKTDVPSFTKVVSIPPYNISSAFLLWLFNRSFENAVLILQKEFAERLKAEIGEEKYGWLTVVSYYYVEIELFEDVPKWMFYPQPEVTSKILRLKPKKPPPFKLKNKEFFRKFAQTLFAHRNRKVRNAILPVIKSMYTPSNIGKVVRNVPFLEKRVRELAPEDFGALANALIQ